MSNAKQQLLQQWPEIQRQLQQHSSKDALMDHHLAIAGQAAMTEKLGDARVKGRGGWWTPECSNEKLKTMLKEHIDKGDMRDVMNLAAMIYFRETVGIKP